MQKVLITGAGGFLGGWTVECLSLSGIPVRAGIRRWNSAVRIARRTPEIVTCDVLSLDDLHAALDGCDAVVHCAVGDDDVTVQGTRNVLATAHKLKLRRVVHISSVAVYGKAPGLIDETRARRSRGNPYARRKIKAEEICDEFIDMETPVVVLRPSYIYGPYSYTWTVSFAKRLLSGKWGTFGRQGNGKCNLVYVTDVVQAIYQALVSENAPGRIYNVNGDDNLTWNDYFVKFNAALGQEPLVSLTTWPIALKARALSPVRACGRYAMSRFGNSMTKVYTKSALAAKYLKATETSLKLTPTPEQLKLYGVDVEYLIDKAKNELGYAPQVSAARGLELSVSWLRHHGLLF